MIYTLKNGKRLRVSIHAKRGVVKANCPESFMKLKLEGKPTTFQRIALGLEFEDLKELLFHIKFTEEIYDVA